MLHSVTNRCLVAAAMSLAAGSAAAGQSLAAHLQPIALSAAAITHGELQGTIVDDVGQPLAGAFVSALGSTQAFDVSDNNGRFTFRNLLPGAYLVRARLHGYTPYKGRYVQLSGTNRKSWSILMTRLPDDRRTLLAAAAGSAGSPTPTIQGPERDPSETAWRVRRSPRGVLKVAGHGAAATDSDTSPTQRSAAGRRPSALFADVSGQVNLLTTTSFDRPQDLFSSGSGSPDPIAFVSLAAPTSDGDWLVRGALTQGEISSWIVSGSYLRRSSAAHRYEAGASYSTQQYHGGNPEALASVSDGRRTVGELYAYDTWSVNRGLTLAYGGKYASYWYLDDPSLVSGRATLSVLPSPEDPLIIRASASYREVAPGAEEFTIPTVGPWLPQERTFSPLARNGFRPESVRHLEIAGEGEVRGSFVIGLRAFRQRVDDQIVTLFGVSTDDAPARRGHYHVASAGSFQSFGWGIGVSRSLNGVLQGSFDYTQFEVSPIRVSPDADALVRVSPALFRRQERVHDFTATLNSRIDVSATRFLVVYKLNTAYADPWSMDPAAGARFEVRINQELPFLDFTGANWEAVAGVRNLFRSDLFDGSVYDELLVVRPPKRVVGGVTVRF